MEPPHPPAAGAGEPAATRHARIGGGALPAGSAAPVGATPTTTLSSDLSTLSQAELISLYTRTFRDRVRPGGIGIGVGGSAWGY